MNKRKIIVKTKKETSLNIIRFVNSVKFINGSDVDVATTDLLDGAYDFTGRSKLISNKELLRILNKRDQNYNYEFINLDDREDKILNRVSCTTKSVSSMSEVYGTSNPTILAHLYKRDVLKSNRIIKSRIERSCYENKQNKHDREQERKKKMKVGVIPKGFKPHKISKKLINPADMCSDQILIRFSLKIFDHDASKAIRSLFKTKKDYENYMGRLTANKAKGYVANPIVQRKMTHKEFDGRLKRLDKLGVRCIRYTEIII